MKAILLLMLAALALLSCRTIAVKQDATNHYVRANPPKVKYPIETDMVYSLNSYCHYKLWKKKNGRLFYLYPVDYAKTKRVYLKIKK